jgi:hypothetical protein
MTKRHPLMPSVRRCWSVPVLTVGLTAPLHRSSTTPGGRHRARLGSPKKRAGGFRRRGGLRASRHGRWYVVRRACEAATEMETRSALAAIREAPFRLASRVYAALLRPPSLARLRRAPRRGRRAACRPRAAMLPDCDWVVSDESWIRRDLLHAAVCRSVHVACGRSHSATAASVRMASVSRSWRGGRLRSHLADSVQPEVSGGQRARWRLAHDFWGRFHGGQRAAFKFVGRCVSRRLFLAALAGHEAFLGHCGCGPRGMAALCLRRRNGIHATEPGHDSGAAPRRAGGSGNDRAPESLKTGHGRVRRGVRARADERAGCGPSARLLSKVVENCPNVLGSSVWTTRSLTSPHPAHIDGWSGHDRA